MKFSHFLSIVATLALAPGCTSAAGRLFPASRDAKLQEVKLATMLDYPSGKSVIENDRRVLVRIRASNEADFFVFVPPLDAIVATGSMPAGVPAAAITAAVDAQTASAGSVSAEFPFFRLWYGYGYFVGNAPAAQTTHVIAGSESTKFILEVDRQGGNDPDLYVHRVYAVLAPAKVKVRAIDNGVGVGAVKTVPTGSFVEVRRINGSWVTSNPQPFTVTGQQKVDAVVKAAKEANLE